MRKVVQRFEVEYMQVLDEEGNLDESQSPGIPEGRIKEMYHLMMLARTFDEKLFKLQRSGKIGTYASIKGQEANQVGSALAIERTDWVAPSFRESAVYLTRGVDRTKFVQAWRGDVRANRGERGKARDLPVSIPVGSQAIYATGIAWASKLRKERDIVVTYFGDGATSEGDVHEAMNWAGVMKLPIIFFCQNNQWAISTPRRSQTASETIAQKAIAHGIKGIQVDGNDVLAVYKAVKEAAERARNGEGPTLIEGVTYRMADHTTSDDASKYRSPEEVAAWEKKDPLNRLRKYFQKIGTWSDDYGNWVRQECEKEVENAVNAALAIPAPTPEDMFRHIYEKMLPDQKEQLQQIIDEGKE